MFVALMRKEPRARGQAFRRVCQGPGERTRRKASVARLRRSMNFRHCADQPVIVHKDLRIVSEGLLAPSVQGSSFRRCKMYCQKCRIPLRLDPSLEDLNPTSFDLLVGMRYSFLV